MRKILIRSGENEVWTVEEGGLGLCRRLESEEEEEEEEHQMQSLFDCLCMDL